jgi:hypothetical protein
MLAAGLNIARFRIGSRKYRNFPLSQPLKTVRRDKKKQKKDKQMSIQKNKLAAIAGLVLALAPAAQAATISYLGSDVDTHGAWRSTDVAKPAAFDPNGDYAYGNDGYYTFTDPAGLVSDLPSYITSVTPSGSTFSTGGYPDIDNPSLGIAGTVADMNAGVFFNISGNNFRFKLAEDSHFVLTIILGGQTANRPSGLSLTQTAGSGSSTVAATSFPTAEADADYLFYEIDGSANDEFAIVPAPATVNGPTFSGMAFEAILPPAGTVIMFK